MILRKTHLVQVLSPILKLLAMVHCKVVQWAGPRKLDNLDGVQRVLYQVDGVVRRFHLQVYHPPLHLLLACHRHLLRLLASLLHLATEIYTNV